jgi:uncharacterized protein (TIGR00725 family)
VIIGVIGGETGSTDEERVAYEIGLEIARRGHVLICGGRHGVIREACRGAREAGGHTIGILPGIDRSDMNEFVEFPIVTGLGHARNTIIPRSADALVAIGGRFGTLSEIAFALIGDKPVAGIRTWQLLSPEGEAPPIVPFDSAAEAIDYCERAAHI